MVVPWVVVEDDCRSHAHDISHHHHHPPPGCAADVTQLEEDREVSYRVEREAKRANSSKRKRKARNDDYTQV
jgi:hypothetical protein